MPRDKKIRDVILRNSRPTRQKTLFDALEELEKKDIERRKKGTASGSEEP